MSSSSDIVYIDILSENYWWSQYITGFRWASTFSDTNEYKVETSMAFTDTATSCIIGPVEEINSIRNTIFNLATNLEVDIYWGYIFDCSSVSNFP